MKKILITGADGQLGKCLKDIANKLPKDTYSFLFMNHNQFDINNSDLVESYFFSNKIDCLINCAAYTAVDEAERKVEKAFQINADSVGLLAKECAEQNANFIHISTDYVFNGIANESFTEEVLPQPINVYGKSKLEGERLALENNPKTIIIRTAWLYSQYGNNFLKTMLKLFQEKEEINVVNDQKGTPTNANDLAKAIIKIIKNNDKKYGIFHFTNSGETNWFEFANAIKNLTKSEIKINPIHSSAYPTLAKRPLYSVLNTEKIKTKYKVKTPEWKVSLKELLNTYL